MGLDLYANGAPFYIEIGYIGFAVIRQQIAHTYNREFGKLYEKQYKDPFFKGYTDEEIKRWNEICNDNLDLFLNHSDCDGRLSAKECRAIIEELDKLPPLEWPNEWRTDWLDKYEKIKELLRWCAQKRHTLYFG